MSRMHVCASYLLNVSHALFDIICALNRYAINGTIMNSLISYYVDIAG